MTDMRAQLAVALGSSGHVQDKLDAVMALVGQIERERDEARASVEHLRGDYRRIRKDRDRLLLAWRSARRRALRLRGERDTLKDLRADRDAERESRFRWAEEALTAALEAHQSAIVTMDDAGPEFDAQYAAHLALDLVRSWRPATERNEGH